MVSFLIETRQLFAGSYGKLSDYLHELTGERFSRQSIKDVVTRLASDLKPSYNKIRDKLSSETYSHIDETKWPVNGEHFYLWLFTTPKFVYLTIKNSRGRKIIASILGDLFEGIIISDCLKVYQKIAIAYQKCWAHLLRKTYSLKEKKSTVRYNNLA